MHDVVKKEQKLLCRFTNDVELLKEVTTSTAKQNIKCKFHDLFRTESPAGVMYLLRTSFSGAMICCVGDDVCGRSIKITFKSF